MVTLNENLSYGGTFFTDHLSTLSISIGRHADADGDVDA